MRRLAMFACTGLWLAALVVTHVPRSSLGTMSANDKMLHAIGYFVLGCALAVTLMLHGHSSRRRMIAVSIAAAAYGAFDEVTQPLFYRSASWGDWFADLIGAAAAIIIFETALHIRARRKLSSATSAEDP